ncbi:MAG: hypothetical protein ACK55Z_25495, partial [bacterium]
CAYRTRSAYTCAYRTRVHVCIQNAFCVGARASGLLLETRECRLKTRECRQKNAFRGHFRLVT